MKQLFLFIIITLIALFGCNKLKDKTANANPYDKDYTGPKVVSIDNISSYVIDSTHHRNRVNIVATTQMYDQVELFRNGTNIKNMNLNQPGSNTMKESIDDGAPVIGVSYYYQVRLSYQSSKTSLSDGVSYTTQ